MAVTEPKRRTRISAVERGAMATSNALRFAREALIEHAGLTEEQAKLTVLTIRGGIVPGVKLEISQP